MSDARLAVVVLAAGEGKRFKSDTPKVLHEIAGLSMLGHVLRTAQALNPAHLFVVVRHKRDLVADAAQKLAPEVHIVDQDEIPGTGRAVELAAAALPVDFDGDVVVLSGDVPLLEAALLTDLVSEHRGTRARATLLTSKLADPSGYGRVKRGTEGRLLGIVEEKDASDAERKIAEINAGVYVLGAAGLRDLLAGLDTNNVQGEKYLTDIVAALHSMGMPIASQLAADPFRVEGVNDRAQWAEAAAKFNALIIRAWQARGVGIQDPATTWIDIDVKLACDVLIRPNTQLRGATVIAEGAEIGPDTTLIDTEVGPAATVRRTDARLAVIDAGAEVGPFSYLRPGTHIGVDAKMGAFVEGKNAVIGRGSKVPHLSYVGDVEVGEGSNIGAGTIVANYDGISKYRARVGSQVRTGAHNVFVAPVTIGDGAYSGAGTVIREDVPPGALAVNVAPQRNLIGWVHEHREGTAADQAAQAAESATVTDTVVAAPPDLPVAGQTTATAASSIVSQISSVPEVASDSPDSEHGNTTSSRKA